MGLLHYLSFVAVLAAFAFVTLSLASGLLYVSELIEEHSRDAKVIGQRGIYAIIILHLILWLTESLPFPQILFSIICHITYLQNFSAKWPFISLASPSFIASCVLVIADHFLWFFWFARVSQEARGRAKNRIHGMGGEKVPGFAEIATFFGICVWLAPLFLFLSLSAGDNALPTNTQPSTPTVSTPSQNYFPSGPPPQQPQPHTSLFKSLFSILPSRKRDKSEGLIAPRPRTPSIRSQPPSVPSSPVRANYSSPPPPSPGGRLSPQPRDTPSSNRFKLGVPPPRRGPSSSDESLVARGSPMRRATADGSPGLGLRRASSRGYE